MSKIKLLLALAIGAFLGYKFPVEVGIAVAKLETLDYAALASQAGAALKEGLSIIASFFGVGAGA